MGNKIISIEYVNGVELPWIEENVLAKPIREYVHYYLEGYKIVLDDSTEMIIGIDPCSECSEDPGIIEAQDDIDYFVGSELIDIEFIEDNSLMPISIAKIFADKYDTTIEDIRTYEDTVAFVRIITSKGVLPFGVYNEQNGYYNHDVAIYQKIGEACLYQVKGEI